MGKTNFTFVQPRTGQGILMTCLFVVLGMFGVTAQTTYLSDDFTGGVAANWTPDGGSNWVDNATEGNPADAMEFDWFPTIGAAYSQSVTTTASYDVTTEGTITLSFDWSLDDFNGSGTESVDVQVWDGGTWQTVFSRSNNLGNIQTPFVTESIDVTAFANPAMQVRFRASGVNTFDFDHWYFDNVVLLGTTGFDCDEPVNGTESNVMGTSADFSWQSQNAPVDDHCWNFYIGNVGFDCDENEEFIAATVCNIAGVNSTNNANVNITAINLAAGTVTIHVVGLQPGTFYEWQLFETCDGAPNNNNLDCDDAEFGPFQTWDDPYTTSSTATPATCPSISPGFAPDGSFTVSIGDSPTCAGTYDIDVQAGGAQAIYPVTPVSYTGVAAGGPYTFVNAGPGTYTVIVTETSVCHPSNDPETITIVVPEGMDTEDPVFAVFDILGNIIADNNAGSPEAANVNLGTYDLPEGSCNYQEEWFVIGADNCDGLITAANAVTSSSVTTPGTIFPSTQTSVTTNGFGIYRVDVNWSVGTTVTSVCMTDAAGNNPCVTVTRFLDDYGNPDVSIVGANNTVIPQCATTRDITVTVYVDADCDESVNSANIQFNVGPNSAILSRLDLGGYTEFVVQVTIGSNGEVWNASYSDGLDNGFADVQITVVQAAADEPAVIIAADDNLTIPYCEDNVLFCYSFQIYDDCAPVDPNGVGFASDGSGLAITYVDVNSQTNVGFFEACGIVAAGTYIFDITYDGQLVQPLVNINQQANQAPVVTMPGNLNFTIPVCSADLTTTIAVQFSDDCDNPIDGNNVSVSLGGTTLTPSYSTGGYFEYVVTLTPANSGDLLIGSYTDSNGATTTVDALIVVTDQPDTWAPIIIYPSQDITINLEPCDPSTAITFFEVTATDNCDGDNVPVFNLQLFTIQGQLVDAAVFFGIGGPTVGLALAAPGTYVVVVNATDNAGNSRSEDFVIIVNQDPVPDVNLACLGGINVTLNDNCEALITPSMVLTGEWGCLTDDDFIVTVLNDNPADNGEYALGCGTYDYSISIGGEQDVVGFTGPFAPANWSVMQNVADNAQVTFTGTTMTLETLGSGPFDGADFQFNEIDVMAMIPVPSNGTVSFDYDFNGVDTGWDWYVIDVEGTIVGQANGPDSGSASQAVSAGDVILFGIDDDGFLPIGPAIPSTLVIDNFLFEPGAAVDAGSFTTCWGTVTAEDKTAPTIECADDTNSATVVEDVQTITGDLTDSDPTLVLNDYSCFQETFELPGEDNNYDLYSFTVSADDVYTFYGIWQGFSFDVTGYLYAGNFNPENPCENMIAGSNNGLDGFVVNTFGPGVAYWAPNFRVSMPLQAGQTYTLMVSASGVFGSALQANYLWNVFSDGNGRINGLPVDAVTAQRELVCTDIDNILIDGIATYATYGSGATIPGTMSPALRAILDATGRPTIWDNCGDVWVEVSDEVVENGDCGTTVITRTFNIHDRYNKCEDSAGQPMTASCTQIITLRKPTMDEVILPPFTSVSECDETIPLDANGNPHPSLTGYPFLQTAFGIHDLNETYCNLAANYSDANPIQVCESTYKLVRTWNIIDWCEPGNTIIFTQLIKVGDFTAPEIVCGGDDADWDGYPDGPYHYSTGPFDCTAAISVPLPHAVTDNCSGYEIRTEVFVIDTNVPVYNEFGQVIGYTTEKRRIAVIEPGANRYVSGIQKGEGFFTYTVTDDCGNVAIANCPFIVEDRVNPVAVCDDDLHISIGGAGYARVYAEDVDEGSHDNCTDVRIEVRRAGGVWGEYVDFDCDDVHNYVTVELRVWDDANMNGIYGDWYGNPNHSSQPNPDDAFDNGNICWLEVLVEDKINPTCIAPHNETRHCDDDELLHIDWDDADQLNDVFGAATADDNCNATAEQVSVNNNLNDCGWGTVVRTFRAVDDWGLTSLNACQQVITVYEVHNYEIKFPKDASANCGVANPDTIEYNTLACDLITVNVNDERFTATSDECYKILRTYKVINWCEWDGEAAPIVVGRDEDCDNNPGDEDVWVIVRTEWNGPNPIYSTYFDRDNDETNNNPFLGNNRCGTGVGPLPHGHWANNTNNYEITSVGHWQYTQVIKVYDNEAPTTDVADYDVFCSDYADCTGDVEITFTITEYCDLDVVTAEGFIDLYADGIQDGGATLVEDEAAATETTRTFTISGNYAIGSHAFGVHIEDGCHNITWLELPFEIVDCKAPTPVCINGLTVTLMPQPDGCCAMAIWASDFIGSPITDCTEPIKYSIHRGDDVDAGTEIPSSDQTGLVLDCNDEATVVIYIYAWDSANNPYSVQPDGSVGGPNYDFCDTYVLVQEHLSCPSPDESRVAGTIQTEESEGVAAVEVALSGNMFQDALTGNDGDYEFAELAAGGFDYTVTPHLDVQAENSISTFDLVLITKHILGIQLLDSPYKIIAADVNSSETVTTADMIQLRKLILGVYTEYPNNTFWRFVDADYSFPDTTNPWAESFPEVRNIAGLAQDMLTENFIGIAIGDVNGSALPNATSLDERNVDGLFTLSTEDLTVKAGSDYKVSFTAADLAKVQGYQFTLTFDNAALSLTDIEYGVAKAENFGMNYVSEGMITTSWNGEAASDAVLFTLVFHANTEATLSDLIGLSSRVTSAEAYDSNGTLDVAINFTSGVEAAAGFEVYQNTPNPFTGETKIGFNLPEDGAVSIAIQDVTGKTLQLINAEGTKGYNTVTVKANGATGVLYYTVSTDDYTATKKMIVVE